MRIVAGLLLGLAVTSGAGRVAVAMDQPPAGLATFVHEARLDAHGDPVREMGAQFGYSVSVSGDTLVVGEPNRNAPGAMDSGLAWVFVRSGTAWTLQQTLSASDRAAGDHFG